MSRVLIVVDSDVAGRVTSYPLIGWHPTGGWVVASGPLGAPGVAVISPNGVLCFAMDADAFEGWTDRAGLRIDFEASHGQHHTRWRRE